MSRVWFLRSNECRENFPDSTVLYIPLRQFKVESNKIEGNQKRFLEIIGVDYSKFEDITTLAIYDKAIVPDECFFFVKGSSYFFTQEYRDIIDTVRNFALANIRPVKSRKVYYSYQKSP